jgi:phenylalanyl-tRNA synthetase beta chain
MGLRVKSVSDDKDTLKVEVPPTRSDILHKCDVAEDIGIGFGFNNIAKIYPTTNTVGAFQPNNKFADLLRAELAQAGYSECMTFSLLSIKDNYLNMRQEANLDEVVQLSNPKTLEFEVVRTSLLPGLLRCLESNKKEKIPQLAFELADCCVLAPGSEIGAINVRKISAMVIDHTANFSSIHGLLDLLMAKVGAKF